MAKQLNVNMSFNADTSQAKRQIQELQQTLNKVASQGMNINAAPMREAAQAAKELQMHLNNAVNVNTGQLNLNAFNASLKASNTSVQQLSTKLISAGADGKTAFLKLASSIAAADRPVVTMSTHLSGMFTVLKNTARWQISSTILHGFMGAIQSAYGYAQDLNESLNNIRIVTGYNVDKMADFAEEANKAAKALSTTTTAYTDAALIYYQQGLGDKAVKERTDVTVKMANVSRQSAEEVSNQMTAIWNNFDDGSKKLEYYADVITALGAATASSSEEIATGLEKFSAVAETVGLSYEYATSALATITATTRQSADVVGTALKTLFARIQDLELGETLEDGTTLGKYSAALEVVGVNIKDINGEVKDMDDILDELGEKWNNISKDQQIALAQTVAGTRQYAQLMALMNNWDFMKQNLQTISGSEGTLQRQADIYAESWEASSKRVKASLQSLYSDLIDDKFFISFNNGFAKLLNGVDAFIDGIGGLKTLLIGLGGLVLGAISNKIGPAINQLKVNLTTMFQTPQQQAEAYKNTMDQIFSAAQGKLGMNFENADLSTQVALTNARDLANAKNQMMLVDKELTAQEKQLYSQELELIQLQQQAVQTLADKKVAQQEALDAMADSMTAESAIAELEKVRKEELGGLIQLQREAKEAYDSSSDFKNIIDTANAYNAAKIAVEEYKEKTNELAATEENLVQELRNGYEAVLQNNEVINAANPIIIDLGQYLTETANGFSKIADNYEQMSAKKMASEFRDLQHEVEQLGLGALPEVKQALNEVFADSNKYKSKENLAHYIRNVSEVLKNLKVDANSSQVSIDQLRKLLVSLGDEQNVKKLEASYKELHNTTQQLTDAQQILNNAIQNFNPQHVLTGVDAFTKLASAGMSAAMAINSIRSLFNALSNEDMSWGERLSAILMAVGMGFPAIMNSAKRFKEVFTGINSTITTYITNTQAMEVANTSLAAAEGRLAAVETKSASLKTAVNVAMREGRAEKLATIAVKHGYIAEEEKEIAVEMLLAKAKEKNGVLTNAEIYAIYKEIAAKDIDTLTTSKNTIAQNLLTKSIFAQIAAWLGLQASMASVLIIVGLMVVAVAAVAGAIYLIVDAVKDMKAASPEGQLKKAKEAAQELSQAADDAAQSLQDIKSAFDGYDTAVEKLNECTKGTEEWNDALKEVNNSVLDILQDFPELAGQIQTARDANGMLTITNRDDILAEAERRSNAARNASIMANANIRQAEVEASRNKISREYITNVNASGTAYGEARQEVINEAAKYAQMTFDEFKNAVKDAGLDFTDADFQGFYEAVRELGVESQKAANAMQVASEAIVDNVLGDEYSVEDKEAATAAADKWRQEQRDYWTEQNKKINRWDGLGDKEVTDFWAAYQKATGTNYKLAGNAIIGTDNNRYFQYVDEEGKKHKIAVESMIDAIIEDGVIDEIERYKSTIKTAASHLIGDTSKSVSEIQSQIFEANKAFASLKLGDTIDPDKFQALSDSMKGYFQEMEDGTYKLVKSAEEFHDAMFQENIQESLTALSQIRSGYQGYTQNDSRNYYNPLAQMNVDEYGTSFQYNEGLTEEQIQKQQELANTVALAANSYDQLTTAMKLLEEQQLSSKQLEEAYSKGLIDLASGYETCSEELAAYSTALEKNQSIQRNATSDIERARAINNVQKSKNNLALSVTSAENASKYNLDAKEIENYAKRLQQSETALKNNAKAAADLATVNARLNRGVQSLAKDLDDNLEKLKNNTENTLEWGQAMDSIKDSIADVFGLESGDMLSDNLIKGWIEDGETLQRIADGDIEKIRELEAEVSKDIVQQIVLDVNTDEANAALENFYSAYDAIRDQLAEGCTIGDLEGGEQFVDSLNQLIAATGMTKEQITSLLGSMGMSATLEEGYRTEEHQVPEYTTHHRMQNYNPGGVREYGIVPDGKGGHTTLSQYFPPTWDDVSYTELTGYKTVSEKVPTYSISVESGDTASGGGLSYIGHGEIGAGNRGLYSAGSGKGGGGGGGGKSSTRSAKSSAQQTHRYTKVENSIDTLSGQYDRLGKAREDAWGLKSLDIMDQEVELMDKLKDQYEEYLKEIAGTNWKSLHNKIQQGIAITEEDLLGSNGYLGEDYRKLIKGGKIEIIYKKDKEGNEGVETINTGGILDLLSQYGINGLEFDEYGRLNNEDAIRIALAADEDRLNDWWTNEADQESYIDQNKYDKAQAIREAIIEYLEQYLETANLLVEKSDVLQDWIRSWQDFNAQILSDRLEFRVSLSENNIKRLETAAKILGDNFYKTAEIMSLLYSGQGYDQYQSYLNKGSSYMGYYNDLQEKFQLWQEDSNNPNGIDLAHFIEGSQTVLDGLYETIDSLLSINEQMKEYYGNTLARAREELEKLTAQMEHHVNIMEHLKNMMSLLNKETDYDTLEKIIRSQMAMRKNAFDVSTKWYKEALADQLTAQEEYDKLIAEGQEENARVYKEAVLDKAVERTREAEEQMYADAESYLESVNELYTNTINQIMAKHEKFLTDGFGWDFLSESIQKASSIQDEYLTKTNQIYETNTLLRKLSQDIDKTDSVASKNKLKNFADEIVAMQQQEKLSQSDLAIAKARYELLQAEIALTDAQNAKSTVRLQRDNEGNYGYVYTADQAAIDNAQQNYADKQNDLYNLVLQQTNDYGQKIIELEKERDAEIAALAEEYRGAEGEKYQEYLQKKADLMQKYNDLFYAYEDSYNKGIMWLNRTAATDYSEAWITEYESVINKSKDYKAEMETEFSEIESKMQEFHTNTKPILESTTLGLGDIESKANDVLTANTNLANQITMNGGLIDALEGEIREVEDATRVWAEHYEEIMKNIQGIQTYINMVQDDTDEANGLDKNVDYTKKIITAIQSNQYEFGSPEMQADLEKRWAKIDRLGMDADWGSDQEEEYKRALAFYINEGLTGSLEPALDAFAQSFDIDDAHALVSQYSYEEFLRKYNHVSPAGNKMIRFASGGYTGEWGDGGKLAVLHQKELVLNAVDTANLLTTVQMVRELASAIDLRAAAANYSPGLTSSTFGIGGGIMEQEVTIHAEFPNVVNHTEIEEAFTSLINRASQYANRR